MMTQSIETILLTLLVLLTLAILTDAASAQQRTFYDASGKVVGRSATDSVGTTTNYDSRGRVRQPRNPISDLPSSAVGHRTMSEKCGHERTGLDESTPRETQIISTMRHSE
jgi:YD repeat-containing protein